MKVRGFTVLLLMENQMEKKIENQMDIGFAGVYKVSVMVVYWFAVKELKLGYHNGCIYIYSIRYVSLM